MDRSPLGKMMPAMYTMMYQGLVATAREHGYALAIHGTLTHDMDLVAVPWTEAASAPGDLAEALGVFTYSDGRHVIGPAEKPHGRLAYTLAMWSGYVDLSVMPRTEVAI